MSFGLVVPDGRQRAGGRIEDDTLLRGQGSFVADLRIPGTLHLAVVRSPFAAGAVTSIDTGPALAMPGVVDAFSAEDVASLLAVLPARIPIPDSALAYLQPPLAGDAVRYVGQPVAVVVATDPALARDAAEAIVLEIDPDASLPDPVVVASEAASFGDVAEAFASADVVVRGHFSIARQAGLPVEPRGILAEFDPETRELTVWAAAKAPHHMRGHLANTLGLDEQHVRIRRVDAGGGFGTRGEMHPEEVLVPLAAFRLGRPVSWVETRTENLTVAYQSRGQEWDAAIAVRADGTIMGLEGSFSSDLGAYVGPNGLTVGKVALRAFAGPYRIPAYHCSVEHIRTSKVPLGTARGPGYFEACFVRERLVDMAAAKLGLEPAEIRRRNLVTAAEMPYATGLPGTTYDGGDYAGMLERALVESTAAATAHGLQGVGVSCTVEASGTPGTETAVARLEPSGRVTVEIASASFGQGHETAFGRLAAEVIGVDRHSVDVVEGDTGTAATGGGTFASRTTVMAGSACLEAATALRALITERARDLLGPDAEIEAGSVVGRSGERCDIAELAPLSASGAFSSTRATYTFGACAARVAVDPDTGVVTLLDLVVVADGGRVLDERGAEGQLRGGAVHGAGGALFELIGFDDDGEPVTVTLRDYHVPTAGDVPPVRAIALAECPSPSNPVGARGLGEIATAGAAGAIANAVADALRGTGAEVNRLPLRGATLIQRGTND